MCWFPSQYLLASVYGMPTTHAGPATEMSRVERFAEYVRQAAVDAGYDIEGRRGGGKKALADKTGMSPSSVGRMLAGQTLPDPSQFEKLADALNVPLIDLLVRGGVVSEEAVQGTLAHHTRIKPVETSEPISPEEAARMLGIRNPDRVRMFAAMATTLLEQERAAEAGIARKGA